MLHLLATLYSDDTFRFALWKVLAAAHMAAPLIDALRDHGLTVFEDFSITR